MDEIIFLAVEFWMCSTTCPVFHSTFTLQVVRQKEIGKRLGCESGATDTGFLWIPSKVRWIVLVKLCVKLFWVVAAASTYRLGMTGMPIEAPWSPCCMKGLVLLKLLPPALAAGYQAWHSVWSSEALIQQISKVDSVDFSSLRVNIMNYVGVWLLSHAHRGQWLWCALFDFVTLSLVVRDRFFAIPWDFPWSSSATDQFQLSSLRSWSWPSLCRLSAKPMTVLTVLTVVSKWCRWQEMTRDDLKSTENTQMTWVERCWKLRVFFVVFFICGCNEMQWAS